MQVATFWRLIETTKIASEGDIEQQTRSLTQELLTFPSEEIIQFDVLLHRFHSLAYTNNLWAAAYILMDGCSNDGFADFRGWLLAQGEAIFQAALQNPETLADVIGEQLDRKMFYRGEHFGRVGRRAYEIKTNEPMPLRGRCTES